MADLEPRADHHDEHGFNSSKTRVWAMEYDGRGLLSFLTQAPEGPNTQYHRTIYGRDGFGNVLTVTQQILTGPQRVTTVTYDADKFYPLTVTNPLGHQTQLRYDKRWGCAPVVDPNGIATQHAFDEFGLLAEKRNLGGTSLYRYADPQTPVSQTPVGTIRRHAPRVHRQTGRRGRARRERRARARQSRSPRPDAHPGFRGRVGLQEQVFDGLGRVVGATSPHTVETGGVVLTTIFYSYDGLNRVTRIARSVPSFGRGLYSSKTRNGNSKTKNTILSRTEKRSSAHLNWNSHCPHCFNKW